MRIISLVTVAIFFTGCGSAITNIYGIKTSENQPMITTESEFDKHIKFMKSKENQTVTDELGSYFYKFYKNDTIYGSFTLPKKHENIIQLLVSGKGLLEPLFSINESGELIYNEKATKAYHVVLSKHFNLLPMSDTAKVASAILKHSKKTADNFSEDSNAEKLTNVIESGRQNIGNSMVAIVQDMSKTFNTVDNYMKGNYSIYNREFYDSVLSKIKLDFYISTSKDTLNLLINKIFMDNIDKKIEMTLQKNTIYQNGSYAARMYSKEQYESQAYGELIRFETEKIEKNKVFLQSIKEMALSNEIYIYPAEMLKTLTIAGLQQDAILIDVNDINIKKGTLAEQPSATKLVSNAVADGIGLSLQNASSRLSRLRKEYEKQKNVYNQEKMNVSKFFTEDYEKIIQNKIVMLNVFLGDLKRHLKLSTGIKSQKL